MPPPAPSPTVERLVRYILDDAIDSPFAEELFAWMTVSPRFRAFVDLHRDKIRKKLRGATDSEARRDVRAELNVAQLLLVDRRVQLAFEAYGSGRPGPDFTVTMGSDRFNIEVTRIRGHAEAAGFGALLAKIRQLPPSIGNGVVLAIEGPDAAAYDIAALVGALRTRAEAKDDALFVGRGFKGSRDFRERLGRLGLAFVFAEAATGDARSVAWTNSEARFAFPARAARGFLASLRGTG